MAADENLEPRRDRKGPETTNCGLREPSGAEFAISAQATDTTISQAEVQDPLPDATRGKKTSATSKPLFEVLFESAIQAFVSTILVVVLGSIAIGLVSGIWRQMVPSPPPGFQSLPAAEAEAPAQTRVWQTVFHQHRFLIIFGIVFVATVYSRLEGLPGSRPHVFHPRIHRITSSLSTNWFGLLVGNAFGAMVSAIVLVWVQQFSAETWLYRWLADSIISKIPEFTKNLPGSGLIGKVQAWIGWYGANQLKFTFWFLYVAAVCDDLGIPNLKTFGRWLWQKRARRRSVGSDVRSPD